MSVLLKLLASKIMCEIIFKGRRSCNLGIENKLKFIFILICKEKFHFKWMIARCSKARHYLTETYNKCFCFGNVSAECN